MQRRANALSAAKPSELFRLYEHAETWKGRDIFQLMSVKNAQAAVSPEEITRAKALGFLWDKNSLDRFNGRVITRNGKITVEESAAIAGAAQRFGSGENYIMTTRIPLEIQGSPLKTLEPMREFLVHGKAPGPEKPAPRSVQWFPAREQPANMA